MNATVSAPALHPRIELCPRASSPPLLRGIFLSSSAALLLELSLTRLFSVVLFYHFAFLAISVALLGLGIGGVIGHLRRRWLETQDMQRLASRLSLLCAMAIIVALEVALHTSVSVDLNFGSFRRMALLYLASAAPFAVIGLVFSVVFARHSVNISRLYGADLAGGAAACLATVPLLNSIGAPNSILFSAVLMALAAAIWTNERRWRWAGLLLAAGVATLIVLNTFHPMVDIIYAKGEYRDPSQFEYARWNSISRVEVDSAPDGAKRIRIDADAATRLMNVDPHHLSPQVQDSLLGSMPGLVNFLRPKGEFAIIGPGGGRDVVRAVSNGSPRVVGIEINPTIVNKIMRDRYASYSHHLYEMPGVEIHVSDGRSFIRSSGEKFDVVQMTLVDTWASTAAGAFALSENNLYTVEAFEEYFQHLRPDGMVAITRWEFKEPREALRVVSVAMDALHRLGEKNPSKNLMVVSEGPLDRGRRALVLAKRTAFSEQELGLASTYIQKYPIMVGQYLPGGSQDNPFSRLIASNDPVAFAKQYRFNVAPVDDNAPYFFFTMKLEQLLHRSVDQGIDWNVNLGVAVLGIVLLLSLLAVFGFLIIPMALSENRQKSFVPLLYFVAIGLGYILVEITFIQRFVLFLGHPTYALTVVVFLLLLSSGAGSFLSRRWIHEMRQVRWPLVAAVVFIGGYVFLLPGLLPALVGKSFSVKLLICAALLVPLGFVMGMPFPAGLHAIGKARFNSRGKENSAGANSVEWAWAMNASASVLGSALAMVIAIRYGLNVTLGCGAVAYFLATLLTGTVSPVEG